VADARRRDTDPEEERPRKEVRVERIRRRGGKKKRRGEKGNGKGKKRRGEKKKKEKGEDKKMQARAILTFYNLNPTGEAVLPNVFPNSSNSTREATPPAEPEPELFLEKPKPYQTDPK
jgi:hypothetical protein